MLTAYKSDIARALNICVNTLRTDLNEKYFEELSALGYKKTTRRLDGKVLKFIKEKYGISDNELK